MPEHEIVINVGEETSVKKVKRMAGPGQFRNPDPTEILISGLKGRLKERNVIDEDKKSFYFTPKLDAGRDPQLEQEHKEKIEGNESLKKWINEGKGAILKEIMAPGGFGRDWHLTESFFTINVEEVVEAEKRELAAKKKKEKEAAVAKEKAEESCPEELEQCQQENATRQQENATLQQENVTLQQENAKLKEESQSRSGLSGSSGSSESSWWWK